MIKGCCKFGRVKEAIELFKQLKDRNMSTDETLYNVLLDGCSKSKNVSSAFEIFDIMNEDDHAKASTVTFNSLVDVCVRTGDL